MLIGSARVSKVDVSKSLDLQRDALRLTPAAVHYGRAATVLAVRHRTRLAAYAAHPERFVQGPPRPETLPTAVWINRPAKLAREDAPGATIVTPDDPQHGVIRRSQPVSDDRSITLVTSVESLQ